MRTSDLLYGVYHDHYDKRRRNPEVGQLVNKSKRHVGSHMKTMQSEKKTYIDRASGVEVTQLTEHKGHSHHFYFTNSGWYAQGRKLLFASDRNNRTNLCLLYTSDAADE